MRMTSEVRDELSRVHTNHLGCRRTQLATMLRLSSEIRVDRDDNGDRRIYLVSSVSTSQIARYLRREIHELCGIDAVAEAINETGLRKGASYLVRVDDGELLARRIGILDGRRNPAAGLPPAVVGGSPSEIAAAWRGAFLAAGTLEGPGRSQTMEIACPTPEVAYALASCARRLGVHPMVREARGVDRVLLRDPVDIGAMLTRLGGDASRMAWERGASRWQMQEVAKRIINLESANASRTVRAAVATSARVEWALEILGGNAPEHLADTGELRIVHSGASLEELGQIAVPPLTKDAVAGRLRRLLALADKYAADAGIEKPEHTETTTSLAG